MLVLMTTMVVAAVGLAAVELARLQLRASEGESDMIRAELHAKSAIELGLFAIAGNSSWRSTYLNDTWAAEATIDRGSYTWKLVDEIDGDLSDDVSQPVRLYGKGLSGQAVRVYSVLLDVGPTGESVNLLTNGTFEDGTAGWVGKLCVIASNALEKQAGAMSLLVSNRTATAAGPTQDLTAVVENGTTYDFEVWFKMASGNDMARIVLNLESPSGSVALPGDATVVSDAEWTRVTATLTPSWPDALDTGRVSIETTIGTGDFLIDDAMMTESGNGPDITIVPGSWRREMTP